jgi:predicted transcriptional regulator
MTRRSKSEIIWDMLVAIQVAGGEIKPTRLLYKANLSYNKMKDYLEELEEDNLININKIKDKKRITITTKGHYYVSELRKVRKLAKNIGLR